jgi:hypothetical protein
MTQAAATARYQPRNATNQLKDIVEEHLEDQSAAAACTGTGSAKGLIPSAS